MIAIACNCACQPAPEGFAPPAAALPASPAPTRCTPPAAARAECRFVDICCRQISPQTSLQISFRISLQINPPRRTTATALPMSQRRQTARLLQTTAVAAAAALIRLTMPLPRPRPPLLRTTQALKPLLLVAAALVRWRVCWLCRLLYYLQDCLVDDCLMPLLGGSLLPCKCRPHPRSLCRVLPC